jgi:hypothetical protein
VVEALPMTLLILMRSCRPARVWCFQVDDGKEQELPLQVGVDVGVYMRKETVGSENILGMM